MVVVQGVGAARGLSIDSDSGRISGTATASGSTVTTVTVGAEGATPAQASSLWRGWTTWRAAVAGRRRPGHRPGPVHGTGGHVGRRANGHPALRRQRWAGLGHRLPGAADPAPGVRPLPDKPGRLGPARRHHVPAPTSVNGDGWMASPAFPATIKHSSGKCLMPPRATQMPP